jgi:hypothetical protein
LFFELVDQVKQDAVCRKIAFSGGAVENFLVLCAVEVEIKEFLLGFSFEHISFPEETLSKPVRLMDFENEEHVDQSSTPKSSTTERAEFA